MNTKTTVGLFGTCGKSTWRKAFLDKTDEFAQLDAELFNPQVPNWTPEFAKLEAAHLTTDEVLVFPITDETFGTGSLAETGFSLLQAFKGVDASKVILFYIAPTVNEALQAENPVAAKESNRSRALVIQHLLANPHPNVIACDSLDRLLSATLAACRFIRSRKQFLAEVGNKAA